MQSALQTTIIAWDALGVDRNVIAENSKRVPGRFMPTTDVRENPKAAVVGYGPSLRQTWKELRDFDGAIFTCSGAHKFLVERGVIPTYHVDSDPRDHKIAMLGEPHPAVIYLVASCINPNYLDKLEQANAKTLLWHVLFDDQDAWNATPSGDWIICGGDVAGPRTIRIARLSGYTDIHCFGIDGDGTHAGPHAKPPPEFMYETITSRGDEFRITKTMLAQIAVLFDLLDRHHEIQATFHGDSLISRIAARRPRKDLPRTPLTIMK